MGSPWPNNGGGGDLVLAAVGALQEWSGFAIHTYRYCNRTDLNRWAGTFNRGIVYRGMFDTYNDPASFGELFYHAALLFRRGDIKPANTEIEVRIEGFVRRED